MLNKATFEESDTEIEVSLGIVLVDGDTLCVSRPCAFDVLELGESG
jgi:hypothetical protein